VHQRLDTFIPVVDALPNSANDRPQADARRHRSSEGTQIVAWPFMTHCFCRYVLTTTGERLPFTNTSTEAAEHQAAYLKKAEHTLLKKK
jgi:hypothetical protein